MNLRKFYFAISSIILVFLFVCGGVILNYLNFLNNDQQTGVSSAIGSIFENLVTQKDPVNVLVLGGDKVNNNTDTMMLVNYNPSTAKISILSIPRDTQVTIEGERRKINYAYPHGGIKLAIDTITDLLHVNINYYVYIDTSVFREIVDLLDGVDYYVPADMKYDDPVQDLHINLKEGQQKLYGQQAEQFMRFRHPNHFKKGDKVNEFYDGSDLKRIDAQQNFIKEAIKQKANLVYLPKLKDVINVIFSKVDTNLTMDKALKLSQNVTGIKTDEVNTFKLGGVDDMSDSIWYYLYNGKILNNNTKETADAGDILTQYFNADQSLADISNFTNSQNNAGNDSSTTKKTSTKKTQKSTTKKNPSNSDSEVKKTPKPTD